MAIEITCPRCKNESTHPDECAGWKIKCGHCRHMLELPTVEELARAESAREAPRRPPSWWPTHATVWALRAIGVICLVTGAGSVAIDAGNRPLILLGWLASGGGMLYLAENLRLRLLELQRPPRLP